MADESTRIETIVIGGGQAGLSFGYQLARRKLPFLILDARERIGEAWRSRWDSLRLFTPARYTRVASVDNVIWCTGYQHGFPWIDLPIFDAHGDPRHERGIVPEVPGLCFVGLHFLYALSSATLLGINRDAERIVRAAAGAAAARRVAVV